jgi:HK97 gp10 family phage protein
MLFLFLRPPMPNNLVTCKVQGLPDLLEKLQKDIPEKLSKQYLREALAAGARPIYDEMERNAPVGVWAWLRGAFSVTFSLKGDVSEARAFVGPSSKLLHPQNPRERSPMPASTIARWLEFGHRTRGKTGQRGSGHGSVAANPFITRAFESRKGEAMNKIAEKLKEIFSNL